jgi:hypothetical protein
LAADLPRLVLEINIGERLPVVIADNKAGVQFSTDKAAGTDVRTRSLNGEALS